jgi:hypothetical protein
MNTVEARTSNWSTIALAAGLLLAISSASSYAQVRVYQPVIKVVVPVIVAGATQLVVILTTHDRSKAEAAQKTHPGSRIQEIGLLGLYQCSQHVDFRGSTAEERAACGVK